MISNVNSLKTKGLLNPLDKGVGSYYPQKSRRSRTVFDDILLKFPCNQSPYLTPAGVFVLMLIVGCGIATVILMALDLDGLAGLFGAVTSCLCFFIALVHGYLLLVWRSVYMNRIRIYTHIGVAHLYPASEFEIQYGVKSNLSLPVFIEAMRWDCSPQIEVQYSSDLSHWIPGRCEVKSSCRAQTKAVGNAAIFGCGVIFTDPLNLMRAEIHVEVGDEIEILPARAHDSQNTEEDLMPLLKKWRRCMQLQSIEPESVRAYQNGDWIRRIMWRGYARTQELAVWQPQKIPPGNLVCLIDAGPRMRVCSAPGSLNNQIVEVVKKIAVCAGMFDSVSVIIYHETGAEMVVKNESPRNALDILDKWCLKSLRWRMPDFTQSFDKSRWHSDVLRLWQCYRLYKGVDFRQKQNPNVIDLKKLVDWARTDLMYTAIQQNDVKRVARLRYMSEQTVLEDLMRFWCRAPENLLAPKPVRSMIDEGLFLLRDLLLQNEISNLIWFSDFADDISKKSLNFVIRLLSEASVDAIGVVMEMPIHQLNFIAKLGTVCQVGNTHKLSEAMSFVWMNSPKQNSQK